LIAGILGIMAANKARQRWEAGHADTTRALQRAAWDDDCDPLEGVILHEAPDVVTAAE
jgi:hypothetical protein